MSKPANAGALAEAKAKRQKKILAVTSVIFLALVGFQLPRLMGGNGAETAAPPATDVATVPGSPLAVVPSGKLPDTDRVVIEPGSGQLISFGLFKSKDPFVQQLATLSPALPSTEPTPTTTTSEPTQTPTTPVATTAQPQVTPRRTAPNGGLTPVTTTTPSLTPASTVPLPSITTTAAPLVPTPGTTTPATTTPTVAPTSVAISTNGACESLSINGTFPGTEDIFRVISIAKDGKSVKIGVVGGAYDSGQSAATLKLGEKLTLVNTADGTRYVLLLKAKCDVETQPVSGSATTGTSTVAAPTTTTTATTPTATTPIVTDALDTTTPTG